MSENNIKMVLDNFDSLMLQTISEDFTINKEIQKAIDMNANYVLKMPVSSVIENYADNKITNILKNRKNTWWSVTKIIFILGIAGLLTLFTYNISKNTNSGNDKKPEIKTLLPIVSDEYEKDMLIVEVDETSKQPNNKYIKDTNEESALVIKKINDTTEVETNGIPAIYIPKQSTTNMSRFDHFDFYSAEELMKSYPLLKVYTGDYIIDGIELKLMSYADYKFNNPQGKLFIPMYCGTPFKKGFEHMTFISINKDLQSKNQKTIAKNPYKYRCANNNYTEFFLKEDNYKLLKPFYISNTEVSNINYAEFLYWVKNYNINKSSGQIDSSALYMYTFHRLNTEVEKRFNSNTINVYPNLECWNMDYTNNSSMADHYFSHPAYDNYPVVGVSYWQALAFLDWLTYIWQTRIDEQNIPYDVEFDLPYEYEWEIAANEVLSGYDINNRYDNNILCDLGLKYYDDYNLRELLGIKSLDNIKVKKSIFTYNVDFDAETVLKGKSSIKNMEANVSEWVKMDYSPYWENYINKQKEWINLQNKKDKEYVLILEKYFNETYNQKNGKMVNGANWLDRRMNDQGVEVANAIFSKVFVNPDSQYPTLGFRFVMRVSLKNEEKIIKKVKILGRNLSGINYSLLKQKKEKQTVQNGFSFIPMGEYKFKEKTQKQDAFYAQTTEVNNLTWMLFLNYLIDNDLNDDLKKCIPNDKDWAVKMSIDNKWYVELYKIDKSKLLKNIPFTNNFIIENKIDKMSFTNFAFEPVVGISYEAANIFAKWFTEIYRSEVDFRLPTEAEWEYMASAGNGNAIYAWDGYFLRDYRGAFMANFCTSKFFQKIDSTSKTIDYYSDEDLKNDSEFNNIIVKQNSENSTCNDTVSYSGILPVSMYKSNNYGLYDICGNASEMVVGGNKTKGGSWASIAYFLRLKNEEKWNGKASDCVGFRLVQTYMEMKK